MDHTCTLAHRTKDNHQEMIVPPFSSDLENRSGFPGDVLSQNVVLRAFVLCTFTKLLLCVLSESKMCVLWPQRCRFQFQNQQAGSG
jgi:hypothetical protein